MFELLKKRWELTPLTRWGRFLATIGVLAATHFATAGETPRFDAELLAALNAACDEAAWPGVSVDEAAANLKTADGALKFVRDGIASVDYRGSYHNGAATLRTRVANDIDKARLLAELLQRLGYTAELVSAPRREDFPRHIPAGIERPRPAIQALKSLVANLPSRPSHSSQDRSSPRDTEEAAYAAVDGEVERTLALLKRELSSRKWQAVSNTKPAPASPTTWVLVRARKPGKPWQIFDSYRDGSIPPTQVTPVKIDSVTAKVIVESRTENGQVDALITWEGTFEQLAGFDVFLEWYPRDVRLLSGADLILPLDIEIKKWRPVLRLGTQRIVGKALDPRSLALVQLRIDVADGASPIRRQFVRALQDFGSEFEQHEFFANHRLSLGVAGVPASVVEWRVLDELRDLQLVRQWVHGRPGDGRQATSSFSMSRGVSTRTARVVNKLIATIQRLDQQRDQLIWNGPSIVLETTRLRLLAGDVESSTMLDQINAPFVPVPSTSVDFKLRFGIATCAAEAQLVDGISVNQRLLDGRGPFQQAPVETTGTVATLSQNEKALVLTRAAPAQVAWIVLPDGSLKGVVFDRAMLLAKGGQSNSRRVPYAGGALVGLGGATLVASGGAALGPVVGGVAGYLFALRRTYGSITQRIEEIGILIELGTLQASGNLAHRDIVSELLNGFGEGYAIGYGVSVAGAGISGYIGAGPGGATAIAGGLGIGSQTMLISDRDIETIAADR